MLELVLDRLELLIPTVALLFGVSSATHALLNKRDPRSQLGWVTVCLFVPLLGAVSYWSFGVNRIRTRARRWQEAGRFALGPDDCEFERAAATLSQRHPDRAETLSALLKISARVTGRPLLSGNRVTPLFNGEEAFPAMLEAIANAERYVYLCTYIFDVRGIGERFIEALHAAAERGVTVYVLIDAIGDGYSRPRASRRLRRGGIKVARFLPFRVSLSGLRVNLRNHRKLLVVDGCIGFTGGMNIGQRHMVEDPGNSKKTQDIHFKVEGPAVYALEHVFIEDWVFAADRHSMPPGRSDMEPVGEALCRGIKDGPNEDFEAFQWILLGAISCARKSVKIMTPYFIPPRELVATLTAAALRGVDVEIILPKKNNVPIVAWAMQGMLPELLRYGVRAFYQPPPFAHSKLLIVDDFYVNIGSANLDPRSLQLNFEFNLEVYDPDLGAQLSAFFDRVRVDSEPLSEAMLLSRGFLVRLRDATFQLFAPYL